MVLIFFDKFLGVKTVILEYNITYIKCLSGGNMAKNKLKEMRMREYGIDSKSEFASILEVEPPTITNWEKGNRFPKEDMLIKNSNKNRR